MLHCSTTATTAFMCHVHVVSLVFCMFVYMTRNQHFETGSNARDARLPRARFSGGRRRRVFRRGVLANAHNTIPEQRTAAAAAAEAARQQQGDRTPVWCGVVWFWGDRRRDRREDDCSSISQQGAHAMGTMDRPRLTGSDPAGLDGNPRAAADDS